MWKISLLLIIVMIAQSTVVDLIEISGIIPDFRIVFIVLCSLRYGPIVGSTLGFVSGFILDVYSYQQLGAGSMAGAIMGYMLGLANEHVIELDRISKVMILGLAFILHDVVYALCLRNLENGVVDFLLNKSLASGLYTLILGTAFIYVLDTDLKNESK